jgi:hypothetical protein
MSEWRKELAHLDTELNILRRAVKKLLELNHNPKRIHVGDVVIVCMLTGLIPPETGSVKIVRIAMELMVFHGYYDDITADGYFVSRYESPEI